MIQIFAPTASAVENSAADSPVIVCGAPAYQSNLDTHISGCSRFIVHWEIRETMTEADVETILQRAREKYR